MKIDELRELWKNSARDKRAIEAPECIVAEALGVCKESAQSGYASAIYDVSILTPAIKTLVIAGLQKRVSALTKTDRPE